MNLSDLEDAISATLSQTEVPNEALGYYLNLTHQISQSTEGLQLLISHFTAFQQNSSRLFTLYTIKTWIDTNFDLIASHATEIAAFLFSMTHAFPSPELARTQARLLYHMDPPPSLWDLLPQMPNLADFLAELKDFRIFWINHRLQLIGLAQCLAQRLDLEPLAVMTSEIPPEILVPLIPTCLERQTTAAFSILSVLVMKTRLTFDIQLLRFAPDDIAYAELARELALVTQDPTLCFSLLSNPNDQTSQAVIPFFQQAEVDKGAILPAALTRLKIATTATLRDDLLTLIMLKCDTADDFVSLVNTQTLSDPIEARVVFEVLAYFKKRYFLSPAPNIEPMLTSVMPFFTLPAPLQDDFAETYLIIAAFYIDCNFHLNEIFMSVVAQTLCPEYDADVHSQFAALLESLVKNATDITCDAALIPQLLNIGLSSVAAKLVSFMDIAPAALIPLLTGLPPATIVVFASKLPSTMKNTPEMHAVFASLPLDDDSVGAIYAEHLFPIFHANGFDLFLNCVSSVHGIETATQICGAALFYARTIPAKDWIEPFVAAAFAIVGHTMSSVDAQNGNWFLSEEARQAELLLRNFYKMLPTLLPHVLPATAETIKGYMAGTIQVSMLWPEVFLWYVRTVKVIGSPEFVGPLMSVMQSPVFDPQNPTWKSVVKEIVTYHKLIFDRNPGAIEEILGNEYAQGFLVTPLDHSHFAPFFAN